MKRPTNASFVLAPWLGAIALGAAACGPSTSSNDAGGDATAMDGAADTGAPDAVADAGAPDASPADAGPDVYDPYNDPDARSPDTALTAPDDTWTWVPFGDAVCGNGSSTGLGVNLHPGATRTMIFLQGGGACWNATYCYQIMLEPGQTGTAANFTTGYGATDFAQEHVGQSPLFSRDPAVNPYADMNFVYIPYCTGDVFSGSNIRRLDATHTAFFMGYRNLEVYLRRLVPTFGGDGHRIWLTGVSAGGFGAAFNWERVQTAFGSTRVDLVDDSGTPIDIPDARWTAFKTAWNMQFPADCPDCAAGVHQLIAHYQQHFSGETGHRFAFISWDQDSVIPTFFGITTDMFRTELLAATTQYDGVPFMRYFITPGMSHVVSLQVLGQPSGTALHDWLVAMQDDTAPWASVRPAN